MRPIRGRSGAGGWRTPREIHLANERYGYELRITTLARKELACTREAEGNVPADRWEGADP